MISTNVRTIYLGPELIFRYVGDLGYMFDGMKQNIRNVIGFCLTLGQVFSLDKCSSAGAIAHMREILDFGKLSLSSIFTLPRTHVGPIKS